MSGLDRSFQVSSLLTGIFSVMASIAGLLFISSPSLAVKSALAQGSLYSMTRTNLIVNILTAVSMMIGARFGSPLMVYPWLFDQLIGMALIVYLLITLTDVLMRLVLLSALICTFILSVVVTVLTVAKHRRKMMRSGHLNGTKLELTSHKSTPGRLVQVDDRPPAYEDLSADIVERWTNVQNKV